MRALLPLILLGILLLSMMVGRGMARKLRWLQEQLAAYRRGDYRRQLEIVEGFRNRGSEPKEYLFFHAIACFELGRLQEAENAARRGLALETNPKQVTICRDQLGKILMEQGRWEEAGACFEECIREAPHRGSGHRAMVELLLRQGKQPEAALTGARRAVEDDRAEKVGAGKLAKESHDHNLAESLAFLAWALAVNGAAEPEVEGALKESFTLSGDSVKPIAAELHFCAGHAYAAIGNSAESLRQFRNATEIDPDGNYGRLSRTAVSIAASS